MKWLKRHPTIVNISLAFATALCASLWANFYTSSITNQRPLEERYYLLIIMAIGFLLLQILYNRRLEIVEKWIIRDILAVAVHYMVEHASPIASLSDIRVIIHLSEYTRPGPKLPKERCLVPRYWVSPTPPRDRGPIPLDLDEFKAWYINVQAFHGQKVICDEPDFSNRPQAYRFYITTPSLFSFRSVISAPIWDRTQPPPM